MFLFLEVFNLYRTAFVISGLNTGLGLGRLAQGDFGQSYRLRIACGRMWMIAEMSRKNLAVLWRGLC